MRLCQTIICQTTPLWVRVAFPPKGIDIPTVNNPGKGSVLGQEMRIWLVLRMKAQKLLLLSLHPRIDLIRTLGQGAAWNCSSDRCSAIPGDDRGAVRFYDILTSPSQQVFSNGYHIDSTELRPTHVMTWKECGAIPDFHLMTVMQQSPSGVSYVHRQRSLEDPQRWWQQQL